MKLFYIIKKNFKLLTRNKGSALVVLLGPLVLMLLISLSFNNSTLFDIKIGAYSESYSELSESVLAQLEDEQYKVVKLESEQECIDSVKSENLQLCLSIPKDLDVKSSESLTFYVDNSKISLKSEELSTDLTTQIVNVLNDANVKIAAESPNIPSVETTLSSTESKIAEVNSQISGLKPISSEVSNVKTSINASNLDFANLTSLASELDSKIAELKSSSNDLSSLSSQIALEKEKINKLNSALNSILTNINSIEIKEIGKIVNPISTEITPVTSGSTHLGNAFPALLMIVLMFTGIVLSAATVMDEKTSKAYLRNYISPTPSILFIIGDYIFSLLIMILQVIVIFLVIILATKAPVNYTELLNVLGAIILIASVFILLGMFIGYIFKNSETSNMASISIAAILLFFSSTVLPLETLPATIREIVKYNPFVLGESLLRQVIIFKETLEASYLIMSIFVLYIAVLAVLTYFTRKLNKNI